MNNNTMKTAFVSLAPLMCAAAASAQEQGNDTVLRLGAGAALALIVAGGAFLILRKRGTETAQTEPEAPLKPIEIHPENAVSPHKLAPSAFCPPMTEDELPVGAVIGGRYRVEKVAGRGGMGIVYAAQDTKLGGSVAVKKLRRELADNERERKYFMDEARRMAALRHPNIVELYDMPAEGAEMILVFELVEGYTADDIIRNKGKIPLKEAVAITRQVCAALSYAHTRKTVHRDIKPSNIIVQPDGVTKVMDFGIAAEAKNTISRLTGSVCGTMAYMAPEQELGRYDTRSDIFATGATFYELITGSIPFTGPNYIGQKRKMEYSPAAKLVPGLPAAVDAIFAKALQPEREKRYQSMAEMDADLAKLTA